MPRLAWAVFNSLTRERSVNNVCILPQTRNGILLDPLPRCCSLGGLSCLPLWISHWRPVVNVPKGVGIVFVEKADREGSFASKESYSDAGLSVEIFKIDLNVLSVQMVKAWEVNNFLSWEVGSQASGIFLRSFIFKAILGPGCTRIIIVLDTPIRACLVSCWVSAVADSAAVNIIRFTLSVSMVGSTSVSNTGVIPIPDLKTLDVACCPGLDN